MTYARNLARLATTGIPVVTTTQDLRDLPIYSGLHPVSVQTLGAKVQSDGGGGFWRWQSTRTDTDNFGVYLLPTGQDPATPGRWVRQRRHNQVDASWWGLVNGGVVDNAAVIQAAIAYAETIDTDDTPAPGVTVDIPPGIYLVNTELVVRGIGITLAGPIGRGAKLLSPNRLIRFGLDGDTTKQTGGGLQNLVMECTVIGLATSVGLTLWRSNQIDLINCEFWSFYVGIDAVRTSEVRMDGCRFAGLGSKRMLASILIRALDDSMIPGDNGNPGGGMHITDCEIRGGAVNSSVQSQQYGILVYAVDGMYITQTHIAGCNVSLSLQGLATPADHSLSGVFVENCYFDGPTGPQATCNNVDIVGVVSNSITLADASVARSKFAQALFSNCFFRAGGWAIDCLEFNVKEIGLGGWEASEASGLAPFIFTACQFSKARRRALNTTAMDAIGGRMIFTGCLFDRYNEDDLGGDQGAAIYVRARSFVMSGCVFRNQIADTQSIVALAFPLDSAVITGNDFSDAACSGNPIRIYREDLVNSVVINGNNPSGAGRQASFLVNLETTDDTAQEKPIYIISEGNGGLLEAVVTGNRVDAGVPTGEIVVVRYAGAYRRVGSANPVLENGTDTFPVVGTTYNPTSVTVPRIGKLPAGLDLRLFATGRAAQTWAWTAQVRLIEAT